MGRIEDANEEALRRMFGGEPVLIDVRPAEEVIAGLGDYVLLHAGPPIEWERMCGPRSVFRENGCGLEGHFRVLYPRRGESAIRHAHVFKRLSEDLTHFIGISSDENRCRIMCIRLGSAKIWNNARKQVISSGRRSCRG